MKKEKKIAENKKTFVKTEKSKIKKDRVPESITAQELVIIKMTELLMLLHKEIEDIKFGLTLLKIVFAMLCALNLIFIIEIWSN